jgi:hypothetical protein
MGRAPLSFAVAALILLLDVEFANTASVPAGDDVLGDVTQLGLRWTPLRHLHDPAPGQ